MKQFFTKLGTLLHLTSADKKKTRWTRDEVFVMGVLFLPLLLVALLVWDGYIFYKIVLVPHGDTPPAKKSSVISSSEVKDIIKLLDARQEKFNELLSTSHVSGGAGTSSAATK